MLIIAFHPRTAAADVWLVRPDSTGAVINIQAGIDSCAGGDTVLAAPGTYRGDGNWDLDFRGKPIVVMSMSRFDTTVTAATIIDCDDYYMHRAFRFHSGETESSILEGFEIINGGERSISWPEGGAIRCESSSPTIQFNNIHHCGAESGGGIASISASPWIRNNRISYCLVVNSGGGIYCRGGSPRIENNRIYRNDCHYGGGGGILLWSCSGAYVSGNEIEYNYSASDYILDRDDPERPVASPATMIFAPCATQGGGVWISQSSGTIENNRITRNGGGITADYSDLMILNNEIGNSSSCGIDCYASAVVIDGNNVYGNYGGYWAAGGIGLSSSLHSTISNNVIYNNDADYSAGLRYSGDPTSVITGNTIIGNYGGIECSSSITISGNLIKQNGGGPVNYGAAIRCGSGSPRIYNNIISDNFCPNPSNGIVYCSGGSPVIEYNTIVGNSGYSAIYCRSGSTPVINNCIIAYNTSWYPGDVNCAIYTESPTITISCCDIFENGDSEYIGIPDQTGLNGNFSADPFFCAPYDGDYHLHAISPCLPGNHPYDDGCGLIGALGLGCEYIETLLLDYRVALRSSAMSVTWSISEFKEPGSFALRRAESPAWDYSAIPGALITGDGTSFSFIDDGLVPGRSYVYRVDIIDERGGRLLFETDPVTVPLLPLALHQNYPNPFNPSTTIDYYLPEDGAVTLHIYDVSGRLISRLVDEEQDAGPHSVLWDGLDGNGNTMSSGAYFYRLSMGKETISRKMVLLR